MQNRDIKNMLPESLQQTEQESLPTSPAIPAGPRLSEEQQTIHDALVSTVMDSRPSFNLLTGKAGTGKSVLLRAIKETLSENHIPYAVCAFTGTAALNVGGETIHRAFGFKPETNISSVKKTSPSQTKLRNIRVLIIDEISMVRADIIDMCDYRLRQMTGITHLPFGGKVVIAVGDPAQLAPVVQNTEHALFNGQMYPHPYFFAAQAYSESDKSAYNLTHVFRQSDNNFVRMLNAIREGQSLLKVCRIFNKYCGGETNVDALLTHGSILVRTNKDKDVLNQRALDALPGSPVSFRAKVDGTLKPWQLSCPAKLDLKVGSRVMVIKNQYEQVASYEGLGTRDVYELSLANGDLGEVLDINAEEESVLISVDRLGGQEMRIGANRWDEGYHTYNPEKGEVEFIKTGSVTALPLALANAMTIHKSQGKSIDNVVIDVRSQNRMQPGMVYTALTRATSLEGLKFLGSINMGAVSYCEHVLKFNKEMGI